MEKGNPHERRELILYLKTNYKGLASVKKIIKEYKGKKAT
jgi:hypothetical protein